MRCHACGRRESEPGCRTCHFVADHADELDGTRVIDTQVHLREAPWRFRPTLKAELLRAWERYPADPHNA
jgi:hypothetical protein